MGLLKRYLQARSLYYIGTWGMRVEYPKALNPLGFRACSFVYVITITPQKNLLYVFGLLD